MQLNFELKLRNYKNNTSYNAPVPWNYPFTKDFSPQQQWEQRKTDTSLLNPEFKTKYYDKFIEKNANHFRHQIEESCIDTTRW